MLSLAATQMSHKLWFSSSTFGNPQRFPICAARPPRGVAHAVGVGAAPLPLRLGLTLLPLAITQASHKLCFPSSKFWNPQRFRICAARLPQAVARAAAHVCVDVTPLSLTLGLTLLPFATTQVPHKLWFSSSEFGNPQRFRICAARPPQAVARAVADVRVDAAPRSLKLGLTWLQLAPTQVLHKLWFSSSKFGNPQRFQICAARLPQAVARAGAHVRAGAAPCSPPLWFALLRSVITQLLHIFGYFQIFKMGTIRGSRYAPRGCLPQLRARAHM